MTTAKRVKDGKSWHHGRIVRMGGCESLVLAPEIAEAAGLAWGDEVRATVERGRLVIERSRSATSPEDVALGALAAHGCARVEHQESLTPRGRRVRSSRYYPVDLPQTAPRPGHLRLADREVLDAAKGRRKRVLRKLKARS